MPIPNKSEWDYWSVSTWLEHQLLSLQHVLLGLEQLRDTIGNDRKTSSKNAEVQRASLHVISTNH